MLAFETTLRRLHLQRVNIVLRLQVSVGNLILELSKKCVRIRGVETQVVCVLYVRYFF